MGREVGRDWIIVTIETIITHPRVGVTRVLSFAVGTTKN